MMRLTRWLLPHSTLTLLLTIVWVMLQNSFTSGMVVFGVILGTIIPIATSRWWPDRPKTVHLGKLVRYCFLVMWDITVANAQVAWIVLTKSNAKIRPVWVVIPLDLRSPEAITVLAGTITLTPGTVTADLSNGGHSLLVHALDAEGADAVRDDIKGRYERRLKEIFR